MSPGEHHGLRVLRIGYRRGSDGQQEAPYPLFSVLRAVSVGTVAEGAVDRDPGAPPQLKHKAARADDCAEQVQVVLCQVVQGRGTLAPWGVGPRHFIQPHGSTYY